MGEYGVRTYYDEIFRCHIGRIAGGEPSESARLYASRCAKCGYYTGMWVYLQKRDYDYYYTPLFFIIPMRRTI